MPSNTNMKLIIDELIDKYNHYINNDYITPLNSQKTDLFKINFEKLNIDIQNGYPKYYYHSKDGKDVIYAIQLRPILKHETKIVIGCGNNPTSLYYNVPYCNKRNIELKKLNIKKCSCKTHLHENCVTIDPDISMNPTIITMFGKCKLEFLKSHSFKKIETEGVNLNYFSDYKNEKRRLLPVC